MPRITLERAFVEIKPLCIEAIDLIGEHGPGLVREWQRRLRNLGLSEDESDLVAGFDFEVLVRCLRKARFETLERYMLRAGEHYARREVSIRRMLTAYNILFEICVSDMIGRREPRCDLAVAMARLCGMAGTFLVSGFWQQESAGQHALAQRLTEAEHRLHGASAYVTTVYERERRRLSHDLHDDIGHQLLLLKLYLEMIASDVEREEVEQILPRLEEALGLVSYAIESVRRLVLDLGPAILEELGFASALKFYARQFSSRTGIDVSVQEGRLRETPPLTHQIALYRVLQEALSNVVKHSRAKNVKVNLWAVKQSELVMTVEDDGVGFDPSATRRGSVGMTAMRERVEVLGGNVDIESSLENSTSRKRGTRIEIHLPLLAGVAR